MQAEGDDFGGIGGVCNHVEGRNWLFLSANAVPVNPGKEGMLLKRVVPAHSQTFLRLHLQQLVNEGLELLVLYRGGPLEVTAEDFIEDY